LGILCFAFRLILRAGSSLTYILIVPYIQIEIKVRLSGLTKQDYIVSRLTDREIRVVGNPRVYKALKNQMADIYAELQRLTSAQEVAPDMLETLQMIAITLNGMKEDGE